jgi:hypothetical protein
LVYGADSAEVLLRWNMTPVLGNTEPMRADIKMRADINYHSREGIIVDLEQINWISQAGSFDSVEFIAASNSKAIVTIDGRVRHIIDENNTTCVLVLHR